MLKGMIVQFLFQSSVTVLMLANAALKYMEMCGTFSSSLKKHKSCDVQSWVAQSCVGCVYSGSPSSERLAFC